MQRRVWIGSVVAVMGRIAACGLAAYGGLAACGGKAVVDRADSSAGGSSSVTSSATSMNVTSNVATTSTGMMGNLCEAACDSLQQCGGGPGGCVDTCQTIADGVCGDIHQRWLSCSLGEGNTMCGEIPGTVCFPDLNEYLQCAAKLVGGLACSAGPDACSCEAFVSPGFSLTQRCDGGGCACIAADQLIGRCDLQGTTCDIVESCCAGVFFTGL
jgi:hypothetical protein